jgi:hypothetical protein
MLTLPRIQVFEARLLPSTLLSCANTILVSCPINRLIPIYVEIIQIYDWICTLDREVRRIATSLIGLCESSKPFQITHVWSRPLSTGTLLFALNRYSPFIDVFVVISSEPRFHAEFLSDRNVIEIQLNSSKFPLRCELTFLIRSISLMGPRSNV